jgi:hypothetical protein
VFFLRNETCLLRAVTKYIVWTVADVAELADALDSKSSIFTDVWVRPPPSAPYKSMTYVISLTFGDKLGTIKA